MLEWKLNATLDKNPELIKSPNRSQFHPLITKYQDLY